ncbi:zona pellucida sperm-binding protein 3-like isoform X1 [Phasianus colchicus]|uniref:Zona pellucida sperm-binding protein 3 n=1 Tax=Phasianus colchicus TaxID=9054 RepID=A0A669P3H0_PHACC|nr:zona pellucida sperm-binding protein 3-like isoform X1 [Phasianus colchicus]
MRFTSCLGFALFCCLLEMGAAYSSWGFLRGETELWGAQSLGQPHAFSQPSPWVWVDVSQLQAASPLHPVSVWCQEAQVVVTVHRDLFGTGRLVRAADLTLGTAACPATAQNAAENVVTFTAGLHECGSTLRVTPEALIYSTSLNYSPVHAGNPVIIRTSPAVVPIECHYPRRNNVSSYAIQPTWAPFHSTLSSEQRLLFSLHLMNDDWSTERASTVFQLGEVLHMQASVSVGNHAPLRLFVDSCVATPSPDRGSSPQYAFIDFSGCMVDGRLDDATSTFISPRPRLDVLQFAVDVFKFAGDSSSLLYITCHLKVSPASQPPDPQNKACSFHKPSGLWAPVEGTRAVCSCCETQSCGTARRSLQPFSSSHQHRRGRSRRELPLGPTLGEADVMLGPLLIHGQQQHPAGRVPSAGAGSHVGLGLAAGLAILLLAALGALVARRTHSNPV